MGHDRPYRRRTYFIKKEYQFNFILKFCLLILLGSLMSTGLLMVFSEGSLTSSFQDSHLVVEKTTFAILPSVLVTNIITLVLITLAAVGIVLFISHKIAGPMFRFEKELVEIGSGDLTKQVYLRKKDQFKDMADSLNTMTENLRHRVLEIKEITERLIEKSAGHDLPEDIVMDMHELRDKLSGHFTT